MEDLLNAYVHAAREAVRLSGTEFVLEDRDLHKRADMTWALESTHDGALKLTSRLNSGFAKSAEEFKISFVDTNDLPRRIADLARSRLQQQRNLELAWCLCLHTRLAPCSPRCSCPRQGLRTCRRRCRPWSWSQTTCR